MRLAAVHKPYVLPAFRLFMVLLPVCLSGCHSQPAADKSAANDKVGAADDKTDKAAGAGDKASDKGADDKADDALPTVEVATVQTGTATKTLSASGALAAFRNRQAALSPPVTGVVDAVPVRVGQTVTRGQIVLHLSTRALEGQITQAQATIRQNQIQVQQAEVNALQQQKQTQSGILQAQTTVSGGQATLFGAQATLAGNEAALTNARQSLVRSQALFKEGLVAQKDVETAELAVLAAEAQAAAQRQVIAAQRETVRGQQQAARAAQTGHLQDTIRQKDIAIARQQLASARGALATLITQRAQYTVRAPIGGTVTAVGVSVGETVDTTTKALTISDLGHLQLQIAVPSASLEVVAVGQPVVFTVDALPNRTFQAVIQAVSGQVDAANGTVIATAQAANAERLLKDGMFARVAVTTARRKNAILVPRAAVLFDPAEGSGGATSEPAIGTAANVLKIGKDEAAHKTAVTTGWSSEGKVEIVSGDLKPGDRIATTGAFGLEEGAKVQIAKEAKESKEP